jgi:O-antigen ligase
MENDFDEMTGQAFQVPRMRATGIFNDPNDLSMIIVGSIVICLGGVCYKPWGGWRVALLAPIGFLFYSLTLTQSRGGLLALAAGLATLSYAFYGRNVTMLLGVLASPLVLLMKGRQSDLAGALSSGSGGTRVELWSAGLQLLKSSPVFGIGANRYEDEAGQVAHNSFMQAFTELGFIGGGLFLGIFVILFDALWQLHKKRCELPPEQQALLPFIVALLAAYSVSMLSLSRNYVQPTYLVAGAAACFIALPRSGVIVEPMSLNARFAKRVIAASLLYLASTYLYIKVFFRIL